MYGQERRVVVQCTRKGCGRRYAGQLFMCDFGAYTSCDYKASPPPLTCECGARTRPVHVMSAKELDAYIKRYQLIHEGDPRYNPDEEE